MDRDELLIIGSVILLFTLGTLFTQSQESSNALTNNTTINISEEIQSMNVVNKTNTSEVINLPVTKSDEKIFASCPPIAQDVAAVVGISEVPGFWHKLYKTSDTRFPSETFNPDFDLGYPEGSRVRNFEAKYFTVTRYATSANHNCKIPVGISAKIIKSYGVYNLTKISEDTWSVRTLSGLNCNSDFSTFDEANNHIGSVCYNSWLEKRKEKCKIVSIINIENQVMAVDRNDVRISAGPFGNEGEAMTWVQETQRNNTCEVQLSPLPSIINIRDKFLDREPPAYITSACYGGIMHITKWERYEISPYTYNSEECGEYYIRT